MIPNTSGGSLQDTRACGGGALLISGLIAMVTVAHLKTRISGVLLYWIAFVLTAHLVQLWAIF